MEQRSVRGHADFRRLWTASTISQLGSAIGRVAIPVIAIKMLSASTFQIALLAVITALTTTVVAFPLGHYVEFRRKRPTMIASDVLRFAGAISIPVSALFGWLTFVQLCVVTAISAFGQLAMSAASGAHLKGLVPDEMLVDANARLQSGMWLTLTTGPGLGGALLIVMSAPFVLVIDAVSFMVDAFVVRTIRAPEPVPPARDADESRWTALAGGLTFIRSHATLRRMLTSWVLFVGANAMSGPIVTVFYLRHLHFSPWQYGFILGVPSIGGFLGARFSRRLTARLGPVSVIWWASLARSPWFFVTPLVVPGTTGFVLCCVAFFATLIFASLANSTMAAYRQLVTPASVMARTSALWQFASVAALPVFVLAGGLLATWLTDRIALLIAAGLMAASGFLLPRHEVMASTLAERTGPRGEAVEPTADRLGRAKQ